MYARMVLCVCVCLLPVNVAAEADMAFPGSADIYWLLSCEMCVCVCVCVYNVSLLHGHEHEQYLPVVVGCIFKRYCLCFVVADKYIIDGWT